MQTLRVDAKGMATPGQEYMLVMETDGVPSRRRAYDVLKRELKDEFGIDVKAIEVKNGTMYATIIGSLPFTWTALIAFLPHILRGIGIIVTAVGVLLAYSEVPIWVWVTILAGVGLTIFSESMLKIVFGEKRYERRFA